MRRKMYGGSAGCPDVADMAVTKLFFGHMSVYFHITTIAAHAALSHSHVLLQHCLSPDPAYIHMFAFTFSKLCFSHLP